MADAPKSDGGGSGWEMIEIIVVGLLLLTLYVNVTKKKGTPPWRPLASDDITVTGTTDNSNVANTDTNTIQDCVINTFVPEKNSTITTLKFNINGTLVGCTLIDPTVALHAQVIQSNGFVVSEYTNIPGSGTFQKTFDGTITLNHKPKTKDGTILLIPNITETGTTTHTVRIPVTFAIK